jgi:ATP-binding cassette subfamily F protein 3
VEAVRDAHSRFTGDAPYALGRGVEMTPGTVRGLLARFGISGDLGLQQVGNMSGGERTKVALTRLHALSPNVMFLDEPTNHLDLWACAALERSLSAWEGTVLFVSHDRYFIDRVATKVLVFEEDRWRIHEGNYSDYQHFVRAVSEESRFADITHSSATARLAATGRGARSTEPASPSAKGKPKSQRKFPYRKLEDIEADIEREETEIARLEAELADPAVHRDGHRMKQIQNAYEAAQHQLAQLLDHWEETAERT